VGQDGASFTNDLPDAESEKSSPLGPDREISALPRRANHFELATENRARPIIRDRPLGPMPCFDDIARTEPDDN
jgi:hypothetical protein